MKLAIFQLAAMYWFGIGTFIYMFGKPETKPGFQLYDFIRCMVSAWWYTPYYILTGQFKNREARIRKRILYHMGEVVRGLEQLEATQSKRVGESDGEHPNDVSAESLASLQARIGSLPNAVPEDGSRRDTIH